MTLTLEISPEMETQLEHEAEKRGVSLSDLALDALLKLVEPEPARSAGEMPVVLVEAETTQEAASRFDTHQRLRVLEPHTYAEVDIPINIVGANW